MRNINTIVIHYSLTPHPKPNGYNLHIAYHYVIDGEGTIHKTRPLDEIGHHASNYQVNEESIGICVCGNFDTETPYKTQISSLSDLVKQIEKAYQIEQIIGHRDVEDVLKSCPGNNFTNEMMTTQSDTIDQWAQIVGIPEKTPYEIKKGMNQFFKALEKTY